jgi:ankyrin repeat protein
MIKSFNETYRDNIIRLKDDSISEAIYDDKLKQLSSLLKDDYCYTELKSFSGLTILMMACLSNAEKILEMLLRRKNIDINAQDKFGMTALMYACLYGYPTIVDQLLKRKDIDKNIVDERGRTAAKIAEERGFVFLSRNINK